MTLQQQFAQHGYVVMKTLLSQHTVNHLITVCDRIYTQWLAENRDAYLYRGLINMAGLTHPQYFQNNRQERVLFFNQIASNPLVDLLDYLFGDRLYFNNTQLFFNPHDMGKNPYWHRDLQYSFIDDKTQAKEHHNWLTLHVRIPLISENGLELIPHSHRYWDSEQEKNVRFQLNNHTNTEALPGSILIQLEPSDVLIFNAQMIHRGNYHQNLQRKALDICIGIPHPLLQDFLDESGLPTEEDLGQIKNPKWYRRAKKLIKPSNLDS